MEVNVQKSSRGKTKALAIDGNSLARIDTTTFGASLEQIRDVRLSDLPKDIKIEFDSSYGILTIQAVDHQRASVTYGWHICDMCIFNSRLGRRGYINAFKNVVRSSQLSDIKVVDMRMSADRSAVLITAIVGGVTCEEVAHKTADFFGSIDLRMRTL